MERRDSRRFAQIATESAAINQEFVPNLYFDMLMAGLDELEALGLNVGHTGTVTGLLFDNTRDGQKRASRAHRALLQECPGVQIGIQRLPKPRT